MDTTYDQIQAGWSAHGRDGEKIGDIEEIGQNYLLVTKGLIFPKDLYVPLTVVQTVEGEEGRVILDVDKSQVDDMGWDEPPAASEASDAGNGSFAGTGQADRSIDGAMDTPDATRSAGADQTLASQGSIDTDTTSDTLRVPVHEEQLSAERTRDQAGEVRIDKNVVEEERTLDVPVTRDEVQVRRVSTDRDATGDESAFTDGDTIRVPIMEERVQVTKEPRVVEEIEISKRQVTENRQVSDTVRREEINVEDTGSSSGSSTPGSSRDSKSSNAGSDSRSGMGDQRDDSSGNRGRDRDGGEVGAEAVGAGGGALGGAAIGAAVGGPPGAVVGGVIGAAGGAVAGESAEGGDEQGGSAVGGGGGALAGAAVGGVLGGPPGAVVGGAVGAGAGGAIGDEAQEDDEDDVNRR